MKQVNLKDVARHCGVSAMTVSRVVNGVRNVKEETRKRVEAAVAELGYRPDPMMRLMQAAYHRQKGADSRQNAVALAYLDFDCDDFSMEIFQKATAAASALGYDLKHFKCPVEKKEQHRLSRKLWMQGIHGLLFGLTHHGRDISGFQVEKFVMVGIGALHHSPPIDTVGSDYFENLHIAANRCYELGMRRIALAVSRERESYTGNRWIGAHYAFCRRHELEVLQYETLHGPGHIEFVDWVRQHKVEAIIGLQGLRKFQLQLPEVFFACLNDWKASDWEIIADGGQVETPRELLAKEAVGLLDYNLHRRRYGVPAWPRHISIEGRWHALTKIPEFPQRQKHPGEGQADEEKHYDDER